MDVWAQPGKIILIAVLSLIIVMYLLERLIFHTVFGWDGWVRSVIFFVLIALVGWLTYQGIPGVRWLLGVFLILNSLGVPQGIEDVFGAAGALIIALGLLVIQVSSALVLCLAPGIPSFMRYQCQQRRDRKQTSPTS